MKQVNILIIDPTAHTTQSVSVCEPVEERRAIDNGLLRFGIIYSDLNIVSDHLCTLPTSDPVRMIQGIVKEGTRIVSIIVHNS